MNTLSEVLSQYPVHPHRVSAREKQVIEQAQESHPAFKKEVGIGENILFKTG